MMKSILRILICIAMGAAWGWFAQSEWQKFHKKDEWKSVKTKHVATKDDIKILDWTKKWK